MLWPWGFLNHESDNIIVAIRRGRVCEPLSYVYLFGVISNTNMLKERIFSVGRYLDIFAKVPDTMFKLY